MKRDKKKLSTEDFSSNEEDSSSSEDDENAELLTEEVEEGFFKVLSRLKKKDSKLYEESIKFFPNPSPEEDSQSDLKTEKPIKVSQKEYRKWLKGEKEKVENEDVKEELEALHDFWTSPNLSKGEQFLRDYILNKKFLEPDDSFNVEEEIKKLSDEEKEVEEQLLFEHKYNCRFENDDDVEEKKTKHKNKKNKGDKESTKISNDLSLESSDTATKRKFEENSRKEGRKKKRNHNLQKQIKLENGYEVKRPLKEEEGKEIDLKTDKLVEINSTTEISKTDSNKKKRKKRHRSRSNNEKLSQSETVDAKTNFKKKRKIIENKLDISNVKKNESTQNLPRNLQIKNAIKKLKMRHRNMKKMQRILIKKEKEGKHKDSPSNLTVPNQNSVNKQHDKNNFGSVQSNIHKTKFKTKKNKQFHNLTVKEKKNKKMKIRKMHSKKQKATNALSNKR